MGPHNLDFNRRVVRPFACLAEGWALIKTDYWLFLAIAFVGIFIAQIAPLAILVGPAMCGIHICLLRRERDLPVRFEMLFDGFNYFVNSLIATLIMLAPELLLGITSYLMTYVIAAGFFIVVAGNQPPNPNGPAVNLPDPEIGIALCAGGGIVMVVCIALAIVVQALFLFTYPLIVDRELNGWEAVKLSCRAAWANFGGVIGLVLLQLALTLAALAVCCVGQFFLMPLEIAMTMAAYRQVFPDNNPLDLLPPEVPDDDDDGEESPRRMSEPSEGITASSPGAIRR